MNDFLIVIINGIVEGLTEFIPVSSTGHLIVLEHFLAFPGKESETFQISIQCGAILAVCFSYKQVFIDLLTNLKRQKQLLINFTCAILPTFIMGFLFYDFIKSVLFSTNTVIAALIVGGIAMIIIDKYAAKQPHTTSHQTVSNALQHITTKQACMVGVFQVISLWPGMSRSGITIIGGIFSGLSYKTATDFSFCCALPVISAAVIFDLLVSANSLSQTDLIYISCGFVVSFLVGLLAISTVVKWISKWHLTPFGTYRIILALGVLMLL